MRTHWLLPCLPLMLAAGTPVPVSTSIQKVRLHPDEAWVTRLGRIHIDQSGTVRLRVPNLPDGLGLDDVRVQASGPEGTSLGEIRVGPEADKKPETPEAKALLARLEELHLRKTTLDAQQQAATQAGTFLGSYQDALSKGSGDKLNPGPGIIDFSRSLETRIAELQIQSDARAKELASVDEETKRLESEWQALQGKLGNDRTPSQVTVELLLPQAGDVELELATRTKQARWKPSYEARVNANGRVDITLYAAITQASGEDWNGVQMELSNANSETSKEPPRFNGSPSLGWKAPAPVFPPGTRVINGGSATVNIVGTASTASILDATSSAVGVNVTSDPIRSTAVYTPPPPPQPVLEYGAPMIAEASGLFSIYKLDGAKDVPSDGESRRFKVTSVDSPARMVVVVAPRLDTTAFQVARFDIPAKLPLFPGSPVNRFYGSQRLGQGQLDIPPAGQPMELNLGPFQGLRAQLVNQARTNPYQKTEYVLTRQTQGSSSRQSLKEEVRTTGQDRVWDLKDAFILSNDTEQPLDVELQDRLIQSSHESIKVEMAPDTTPGSEERPSQSLRAWTLRLDPRSQKTVTEDIQIHAPKDGDVVGLGALNLQ